MVGGPEGLPLASWGLNMCSRMPKGPAPDKLAKCSECHDISADWSATLRNMHTIKNVQVGLMALLLASWLGTE